MAAHQAEPWRQQPGGNAPPQPGFGLPSYGNPPAYQSRNLYKPNDQGGQIPMTNMQAQAPREMV